MTEGKYRALVAPNEMVPECGDLIDALRLVRAGGSECEHQIGVIRHQVRTAIVRIARGETASNPRTSEDALPPDTDGDTGRARDPLSSDDDQRIG